MATRDGPIASRPTPAGDEKRSRVAHRGAAAAVRKAAERLVLSAAIADAPGCAPDAPPRRPKSAPAARKRTPTTPLAFPDDDDASPRDRGDGRVGIEDGDRDRRRVDAVEHSDPPWWKAIAVSCSETDPEERHDATPRARTNPRAKSPPSRVVPGGPRGGRGGFFVPRAAAAAAAAVAGRGGARHREPAARVAAPADARFRSPLACANANARANANGGSSSDDASLSALSARFDDALERRVFSRARDARSRFRRALGDVATRLGEAPGEGTARRAMYAAVGANAATIEDDVDAAVRSRVKLAKASAARAAASGYSRSLDDLSFSADDLDLDPFFRLDAGSGGGREIEIAPVGRHATASSDGSPSTASNANANADANVSNGSNGSNANARGARSLIKFNAQSRRAQPLRDWLVAHFDHPYPEDSERDALAAASGMTRAQVGNWFINARVRIWRPTVLELGRELRRAAEATEGTTTGKKKTNGKGAPKTRGGKKNQHLSGGTREGGGKEKTEKTTGEKPPRVARRGEKK